MKSKILIAIVCAILLTTTSNAKTANFTDNQTVSSNKTWTVKFTSEVAFDDLTKQAITVTDSKGTKANVGVQLGEDRKTVIVKAPEGGYKSGENYTLNLGNNAHSNTGKAIKTEHKLHFSSYIIAIPKNIYDFKYISLH